ncbi:uncharacterized protein LOC128994117 [Macrosteles quadrilineatus]|uniref:uncharacterized protein LOC128994117 n=1 Tax=Macrosteles quadrilineatus TaxID=74068 RepID=UPI0023E0CE3B|nr:uncharacterized protein LOC128994117 [Macrosteles quadrilineatus]
MRVKLALCLVTVSAVVDIILTGESDRLFSQELRESGDPHPLVNLGNSLVHRLTSVSCPFGTLLYKDLQRYYNLLSDVYRFLKRRDVVEIVKGWKVYDQIVKMGGPPHLNLTLDFFTLKKKYKWSDSGEVYDVKQIMTLTQELWEDIQDRAAHLRSGQTEPPPVEESTIDWTPFLREVSSDSDPEDHPRH